MIAPAADASGGWRRTALLAALLLAGAACRRAPGPDYGSLERFQDDPVVAGLIAQRLQQARSRSDDPAGWLALGMVFEANDFLAEAVATYEHARQLDGGAARTRYRLGAACMAQGDARAAAEHFAAAVEREPGYAPSHWRLGYARLRLGDLEEAAADFRRALEIDGAQTPARLGLARAHLQNERPEEAVGLLERAVGDAPQLPAARYLLGLAYRRLGRLEEARPHLAAAGRGPAARAGTDTPLSGAGRNWRDPWQEELESVRVSHRMLLAVAQEAFEAGDLASAASTLETLQARRPADVTLALNLAMVYRRLGRTEDALRLLEATLERNPDRFQLLLDLALAWREAGDTERALAYAERAAAVDPRAPGPQRLRAEILRARGEAAGR